MGHNQLKHQNEPRLMSASKAERSSAVRFGDRGRFVESKAPSFLVDFDGFDSE